MLVVGPDLESLEQFCHATGRDRLLAASPFSPRRFGKCDKAICQRLGTQPPFATILEDSADVAQEQHPVVVVGLGCRKVQRCSASARWPIAADGVSNGD